MTKSLGFYNFHLLCFAFCVLDIVIRESLRNHDGDAEDTVDSEVNLYFAYESLDTLKSFTLFSTVKNIAKLNSENNRKI